MKLPMKSLIIGGIVIVAMTLEAVIIFTLMPASPAAATDKEKDKDETADEQALEKTSAVDDLAEIPIDSFNCTNNLVAPGSVLHLSFKVIGVVPAKQQISFEENANRTHKTRVRQAIERIARSSSLEDLNDPNLSTIKRLIREETNKILGRSYLTEVVVTDFRMIEQ